MDPLSWLLDCWCRVTPHRELGLSGVLALKCLLSPSLERAHVYLRGQSTNQIHLVPES